MNYIINIVKKLMPKQVILPLGRWRIENCNKQINNKIDLSNEDHCGPCGQYALEKIEAKSNIDEQFKKSKKSDLPNYNL